MNLCCIHWCVQVTDESIGGLGWSGAAMYIHRWSHVIDRYKPHIFVDDMVLSMNAQLLESMIQWYREIDYWYHTNEAQHTERLVPVKEDCCRSWYELWEDWCIEKNCMLFWKEHKAGTECMHFDRSIYVKVVNKDGVSITTKVALKQLRYMPITPRLKRLYLSEETTK
jgi:hypothetical protein